MQFPHDAYSFGSSQNLSYSTSGGAAVSTAGLNAQTKYVRLVATGVQTSTSGVRYVVGTAPIASATSSYLPLGWIEYVRIANGERISALGNDATAGTLNISEALT